MPCTCRKCECMAFGSILHLSYIHVLHFACEPLASFLGPWPRSYIAELTDAQSYAAAIVWLDKSLAAVENIHFLTRVVYNILNMTVAALATLDQEQYATNELIM